jgi:hypothetical protein
MEEKHEGKRFFRRSKRRWQGSNNVTGKMEIWLNSTGSGFPRSAFVNTVLNLMAPKNQRNNWSISNAMDVLRR